MKARYFLLFAIAILAACDSEKKGGGNDKQGAKEGGPSSDAIGKGSVEADSKASGGGSGDASGSKGGSGADTDVGSGGGTGTESSDGDATQTRARVLTAGSFDDSLNFESFKAFWPGSTLLPPIDQVTPAPRFAGPKPTSLDVALVVDVTGSMSDELEFIKVELDHIAAAVEERFPNVAQRYSLIVYRDEGDEYVTRRVDFTSDLDAFKTFLRRQSAGGGGDFPEAMHTALAEARDSLQWGAESAKLLFLVADAPPHNQAVAPTLEAINGLKAKGVHLYPIAASGVDDLAERVLRYAAVVSGGEYIFLTDDSGVGNPHATPHIPCYHVRKLVDVMIDAIKAELEQNRLQPEPTTIIRTVGKNVQGKCE
jgi:Mg-chelatase subunit ChlD